MSSMAARARSARIEVRLHPGASARECRELGAFVRFCVGRIERELAAVDHWTITIVPDRQAGYVSTAIATSRGGVVEAHAVGRDGTLAAWNALGSLEQALREQAASLIS